MKFHFGHKSLYLKSRIDAKSRFISLNILLYGIFVLNIVRRYFRWEKYFFPLESGKTCSLRTENPFLGKHFPGKKV